MKNLYVLFTLKFACFTSKWTDLSPIKNNQARNPILTDTMDISLKKRSVLICNINTLLAGGSPARMRRGWGIV